MSGKHPTLNTQHPTPSGPATDAKFDLEERMLVHASRVVRLCESISSGTDAKLIGRQLVRSGTSPYLHHGEVEAAESLDDFVHKLKICLKELRETRRALRLLGALQVVNTTEAEWLLDETSQLIRIFWTSIRTARSRGEQSSRVREEHSSEPSWTLSVERWMLDVDPPEEAQ